jgi:hypothetical protein
MKPLDLTLIGAAAAVVLSAAPALSHAQSAYDYGVDSAAVVAAHSDMSLHQREDQLLGRLSAAWNNGDINHAQYLSVSDELSGVRDQEDRMRAARDGDLTINEMAALHLKLDGIADRIRVMSDNAY